MVPEPDHWPSEPVALEHLQSELASLQPTLWAPPDDLTVGGCFVCFTRGGSGGGARNDHGWAAAVEIRGHRVSFTSVVEGAAGARYVSGLLALREGPLLEKAMTALGGHRPEVLLVNATGRDHPRRAGLALHLGWMLDLPTIGVTHRPLIAMGEGPVDSRGARSPLWIDGDHVGWWLRTRVGARPLAVSPGWRTDLDTVVEVVMRSLGQVRTPEPIRQARRVARTARGGSGSLRATR
jgi:deoxyribonuclease V